THAPSRAPRALRSARDRLSRRALPIRGAGARRDARGSTYLYRARRAHSTVGGLEPRRSTQHLRRVRRNRRDPAGRGRRPRRTRSRGSLSTCSTIVTAQPFLPGRMPPRELKHDALGTVRLVDDNATTTIERDTRT